MTRYSRLGMALAGTLLLSTGFVDTARAAGEVLSADLIDAAMIEAARDWVNQPIVVTSLRAANRDRATLDQAAVDALDLRWRAERKEQDQPLIAGVLTHPLSSYLTRVQAGSLGLYTEVFVMDFKGLNVGQSSVTSDFWQGDEGKWQKTYAVGPSAVFVDEAEHHAETDTWRAQLNLSIADPDTGAAIGAITIEINLTELDRRRRAGLTG